MDLGPALSLVIPAFNEGKRIEQTLQRVLSYSNGMEGGMEILVVDDGSRDETASLVSRYARGHPQVKLFRLPRNRGKGAAVRFGMLAAAGEYLCFSDADLSSPIEELERMIPLLKEGYDLVIASRALPNSRILVHQGRIREGLGKSFNGCVGLLFGIRYRDTQCGLKCFRSEAARAIFSRSRIGGFAFDVEVLLLARLLGLSVAEAAVRWENSPDSKVSLIRHGPSILLDLARMASLLYGGRYASQGDDPPSGENSQQRLYSPTVPELDVKEALRYGNGKEQEKQ